jgi:hypothetical protein
MSLYSSASLQAPAITVAAHLVFGITAAGVYKTCSQRQYVGAGGASSDR